MPLFVIFVLAVAILGVAGIAGWATVAAARALGGRGNDEVEMRLEELTAVVAGLQADFDELAQRHDSDRELLEERLDFTERLLSSHGDSTE